MGERLAKGRFGRIAQPAAKGVDVTQAAKESLPAMQYAGRRNAFASMARRAVQVPGGRDMRRMKARWLNEDLPLWPTAVGRGLQFSSGG
mgnify:CR=1 FL=1